MLDNEVNFRLGIRNELINGDNRWDTVVVANIRDVPIKISKPLFQRREVFLTEVFSRHTTVEFERPHRCD